MTLTNFCKNLSLTVAISALLISCGDDDLDNLPAPVDTPPVADDPIPTPPPTSITISLQEIGQFASGVFDEGAAEIVSFDPNTDRLFVINANDGTVDILDVTNPAQPSLMNTSLDFAAAEAAIANFVAGGLNSVDIDVVNGIAALAMPADDDGDSGVVGFFDTTTLAFLNAVEVGIGPDSLSFTPDGNGVVVANEGEIEGAEGSISVIDVTNGPANAAVTTITLNEATLGPVFGNPASVGQFLIDTGVVIAEPADIADDLQPEFVSISPTNQEVWITLQENNAVAIVNIADLSAPELVTIRSLGSIDRSIDGNGLDLSNEDGPDGDGVINIATFDNVFSNLRPDTITSYSVDGTVYFVTADEGDAREEAPGFSGENGETDEEVERVEDLILDPLAFPPTFADNGVGRIEVSPILGDTDGDGDFDQLFTIGGRSFSIWSTNLPTLNSSDANANLIAGNLTQVFNSGDDFEQITAQELGENFNSDNDENDSGDSRSDDNGPEPEALAVGEINGQYFAFIGLERPGGIMVYEVTDPINSTFIEYVNNRNFDPTLDPETEDGLTAIGDLAPEAIEFISADNSPTSVPLIAVGNEVSGTTTIYQINVADVVE